MHIFFRILYIFILLIIGLVILLRHTDLKYKFGDYLLNKEKKLEEQIEDLDKNIKDIERKAFFQDYNFIKKYMAKQVKKNRTPVVEIKFENKKYIYRVIGYKHHVSFVFCSPIEENSENIIDEKLDNTKKKNFKNVTKLAVSEELVYNTLDELFQADLYDGICLERDWGKILKWKLGYLDQENKNEKS